MTASVDTLWRSLMKGARGHRRRYLFIDPIVGVKDYRNCAIRRRPGNMNEWAPKAAFYLCMNTSKMAIEQPVFIDGTGDDDTSKLDPTYLRELAERIGVEGELQIQHAGGSYSLHDTKGAFVSFLNLASVRALSEFMGQEIDPRRFRMNVWMTGLDPFEELTWVDKYPGTREILVDDCRFRVDDACERCKAPEANPATGQFDLEIQAALDAMMTKRGYKSPHRGTPRVMGILAAPLDEDVIRKGARIVLA